MVLENEFSNTTYKTLTEVNRYNYLPKMILYSKVSAGRSLRVTSK